MTKKKWNFIVCQEDFRVFCYSGIAFLVLTNKNHNVSLAAIIAVLVVIIVLAFKSMTLCMLRYISSPNNCNKTQILIILNL